MKSKWVLVSLSLFVIMYVANLAHAPHAAEMMLRWLAVAALLFYGWQKKTNTTWIMVFMVVGACFGHDFPRIAANGRVPSMIFIRLVKTIVAPLLFAMLTLGIARHADLKRTGRMGIKALIYFEIVTTIALFIGLAAINISKAGVGINLKGAQEQVVQVAKQTPQDVILHIFPENIAKSVAEGQVLQTVVFCILFGLGLALAPEDKRKPMLDFCESLAAGMFKFTGIVMWFAPLGVAGAISYAVSHAGIGILLNLGKLILTLYCALIVFVLCVLLPVALIFKVPIKRFLKAVAEPFTIAFATTTSEPALPVALQNMERLGCSRQACALVLPLGYSFNLDGSTLYLSLGTVFVAQVAGVHLPFSTQIIIVLTLMLTSKGMAAIPRATLVILLGTLAQFGLPLEPIFIVLGIDEVMDMARTGVNIVGNCLATVVVAKMEGEFQLRPEEEPIAAVTAAASAS
ncbi:MAG: cation:dicarboxylase symporter family transporter [Candidatus Korobacteraceae bacterium]|jgi:proton glutamate symport protein